MVQYALQLYSTIWYSTSTVLYNVLGSIIIYIRVYGCREYLQNGNRNVQCSEKRVEPMM